MEPRTETTSFGSNLDCSSTVYNYKPILNRPIESQCLEEEFLNNQIKILFATNRWNDCMTICNEMILENSSDSDAKLIKSKILMKQGNSSEALILLQSIPDQTSEIQIKTAECYMNCEMYDLAIDVFLQSHCNFISFYMIANCYLKQSQFQSAKEYYLKSIADYNNEEAIIGLLSLYFLLDQVDDAIALSQNSMNEFPSNVDIIKIVANYYLEEKDYTNAMIQYTRISDISARDKDANLAIGFIHQMNNNHNAALEYYKKILNPNCFVLNNIAAVFYATNMIKESKQYLLKAIKLSRHPIITYNLGILMNETGQSATALHYLTESYKNNEHVVSGTLNQIAISLGLVGDNIAAKFAFEKSLENEMTLNGVVNFAIFLANNGDLEGVKEKMILIEALSEGNELKNGAVDESLKGSIDELNRSFR